MGYMTRQAYVELHAETSHKSNMRLKAEELKKQGLPVPEMDPTLTDHDWARGEDMARAMEARGVTWPLRWE